MKKREIKIALIGCGNIGSKHIDTIFNIPEAKLVAICDSDEKQYKKIKEEYGDIPFFTNYKKMILETDANIIDICTPNHLHSKMSMDAMNAGKNVLVEKPLSLTLKDARLMIKTAKKKKVNLIVVKQNRFNKPVLLVQKMISEGKLGKILIINANVLWNRNDDYYKLSDWHGKIKKEGGSLFTQASHFVDLFNWWCGNVIKTESMIETRTHNIETEDCGSSILKFDSGTLGTIQWTTSVFERNYEGSITIIGEKGTIKIGGQYLNKIEYWNVDSIPCPDASEIEEDRIYERGKKTKSNHENVISNYVKLLLGEKSELLVSGKEGLSTIETIEKIYKSAKK